MQDKNKNKMQVAKKKYTYCDFGQLQSFSWKLEIVLVHRFSQPSMKILPIFWTSWSVYNSANFRNGTCLRIAKKKKKKCFRFQKEKKKIRRVASNFYGQNSSVYGWKVPLSPSSQKHKIKIQGMSGLSPEDVARCQALMTNLALQ